MKNYNFEKIENKENCSSCAGWGTGCGACGAGYAVVALDVDNNLPQPFRKNKACKYNMGKV